jgi:hypothetical protein
MHSVREPLLAGLVPLAEQESGVRSRYTALLATLGVIIGTAGENIMRKLVATKYVLLQYCSWFVKYCLCLCVC